MNERLTKTLLMLCGLLTALVVLFALADRPVALKPSGTPYGEFAVLSAKEAEQAQQTDQPQPLEETAGEEAEPQPEALPEPETAARLVDLNTATKAELETLNGVGEVLAQRIIDERNFLPFNSVDDLLRVKGIGEKTLEKIRPFVSV